ncbi:MAG TPA: branched-chain amino acid ABC transporter permease [Streptosporangiaceae bacterium]|nr:branched-chain amino acid ABC transporter permease [Streptosporangiaceae bacterium]
MSEPEGRGVAWTEERGTSDEGRRRLKAPRRRAGEGADISGPTADPDAEPDAQVRVTRSRRSTLWAGIAAVVIVVVLGYLPYAVYSGTTNLLVDFFLLLVMASTWNLLAGYAGLVSVGQQAFIGLGAYFVLILADHGTSPFLAIPVATLLAGIVGLPVWWLVSRLRSGYFSITMWVIASVCELVIIQISSLGGGTGAALPGLNLSPTLITAYTYWATMIVAVVVLAVIYYLLRSPIGLVLTAIRDDETGARSIGTRVARTRRLVFMVAAAGCGAAGALYIISQQFVVPTAAFSVQWSAEMIFITIIGGIGTIEGPILGTIVFFVLQQTLSHYGTWYWIILGVVAMAVAIWAPRGLWGLISDKLGLRLFPVGYYLWPAGSVPRRRR